MFRTAGKTHFDVPSHRVGAVTYPWYYFGGGVQFTVEGVRYRLSFVRPTSEGGSVCDIARGRRIGRRWRQIWS